jgi:membrane fusion protein, copper/silver efflux system
MSAEYDVSQAPVASRPPSSPPPAPVIRGLRAMAIVRWMLLLLVALVAAGTWWKLVVHSDDRGVGAPRYFCPMHPQIRSPNPGNCPICFMTLEPIPDEHRGHALPPASASAPPQADDRARLAPVMLSVERRQAIGVTTAPVTRRAVARELRLNAVIEALEKSVTELRVRTPGFVERVAPVETGQSVRAGQPLVWLYSPEVVRAEEELLAARRLRVPGRDAGFPGGDFGDQVEAAARERLKALGLSNADIERVTERGQAERLFAIHSGGGVVTARSVSVGTYATPEMLLFQVTDLSRVWASASVPSDELASVPLGTRGEFRSRGAGRVYEAEAALVEPRISSDTRAARVRFNVKNGEPRLLPGDGGEIVAKLAEREQTLVPRDAVIDAGNARYAFVERSDGLFVPREVELGPLVGEERVVERGLEPGERVVSRGVFLLDSESRLQASLAPAKLGGSPGAAPASPPGGSPGAAPASPRPAASVPGAAP